ncbi:hypothetical protein ACFLW4_03105 [Chloroflexota bacterium]
MKKLHELEWSRAYQSNKNIEDISYLSLAEIEGLKKGLIDPTEELVVGLKKLLHNVSSEHEINEHLVNPFLVKS